MKKLAALCAAALLGAAAFFHVQTSKGAESQPVFRVERNKGCTVISNYHLRDKYLSLKAKGLLQ